MNFQNIFINQYLRRGPQSTMEQTSSRIGEEQEIAPETEPRDWQHREYDNEDQEDAEFNDAESIQLEMYDEQTVLSIRRMGGTISNEKFDTLLRYP